MNLDIQQNRRTTRADWRERYRNHRIATGPVAEQVRQQFTDCYLIAFGPCYQVVRITVKVADRAGARGGWTEDYITLEVELRITQRALDACGGPEGLLLDEVLALDVEPAADRDWVKVTYPQPGELLQLTTNLCWYHYPTRYRYGVWHWTLEEARAELAAQVQERLGVEVAR